MNNFLFWICRRMMPSVLGLPFLGVLVLAALFSACSTIEAAPVAFRFEAEVTEIQGDLNQLSLPISLDVGDSISGFLSFGDEEDLRSLLLDGPHLTTDAGILSLRINGETTEGKLNSGGANLELPDIDYPASTTSSSILLGWVPQTIPVPDWPGEIAGVPWTANIRLYGDRGTIEKPDGVLNYDAWNALNGARLFDLSIGYPVNVNDPDTINILASLGDFIVVPEPATGALFVSFVLLSQVRTFRKH